jgi:mannose-6-phosphate isomerase-like protein (cupin superfamily)/CDGSH-type Zn-finger protein
VGVGIRRRAPLDEDQQMDHDDDRGPLIAGRKPCYQTLSAGRRYLWCRCGRSQRQPFCDGRSHLGSGFEPLAYTAQCDGEEVLFCMCKRTATPPFCDGTHSNLPGGYRDDALETAEDSSKPWAAESLDGVRTLDETCYTIRAAATLPERPGTFWLRTLVDARRGAVFQSQFYAEIHSLTSPILSPGAAEQAIIFIAEGSGTITLGTRQFTVARTDGVLVLAGEGFSITPDGEGVVKAFISVCPAVPSLRVLDEMPPFDMRQPVRLARVDPQQRKAMGPRFFQHLVDKTIGAHHSTQFIGHIPQSKAEMHRHLYEEALIIVSGQGVIWNETVRAPVAPGDVIFFPRKHLHSLQCTVPEGMEVVGVIHPGDNPGINY